MNLWHKLLRRMGIKTSEQNKLIWTFILTFICGALLCYISSFPIALFLTHYGSEQLPQIYLAVALVSMGFGFAYAFFERHLSFNKLIIGLAFTLSAVLTLLGMALISLSNTWIILILLIWATMAYDLYDFCIWLLINRIYTMQQAKNAFGMIGGCQSIGGLTAGLASPFLLSYFGLNPLMIATGILAIVMVLVMLILLKKTSPVEEEIAEDEQILDEARIDEPSFKAILKNKYVLKMFSLFAFCIFAMYVVDLLFNTAAEARYPNEAELAGFLAVFFGLVDALDLLSSVFLFSWLLKRFGIILTLLILPSLGVMLSLPVTIFFNIPILANLVFWLIVTLKLFEESFRGSLTEMSNLLLLQPFPLKTRSFIQSKMDSIVLGFSTALISIVLIGVTKVFGSSIGILASLGLVFFILSILILLTFKSDYTQAVSQAIASRLFERDRRLSLSKEDFVLLNNYLLSSHPDEVIYALHFIEQVDAEAFSKSLTTVLQSSKNPDVHGFVIDKIKHYKLLSFYPQLLSYVEDESNEHLAINALTSAAYLDYAPIKKRVQEMSLSSSITLSSAALVIILNQENDSAIKKQAMQKVIDMANSTDPKQRAASALIISEAPGGFDNILKQLSQDVDDEVRSNALYAALRLQQFPLYDALFINFKSISLKPQFIAEFKKQIDILLPVLEKNFESLAEDVQIKILKLLGQLKADVTKNFIERHVFSSDFSLRHAALNSLAQFDHAFNPPFLKSLHQQINDEAAYIKTQHDYLLFIPKVECTELLISVLSLKMNRALDRLMQALGLYYDHKIINKAQKGLKSNKEEERGYAIELIDTQLNLEHKKNISPLLIDIFLTEQTMNESSLASESFYQVLKSNLSNTANSAIDHLTSIACAYIVIQASIHECRDELDALKSLDKPFIKETIDHLYLEIHK